jgi:hypothetical protein
LQFSSHSASTKTNESTVTFTLNYCTYIFNKFSTISLQFFKRFMSCFLHLWALESCPTVRKSNFTYIHIFLVIQQIYFDWDRHLTQMLNVNGHTLRNWQMSNIILWMWLPKYINLWEQKHCGICKDQFPDDLTRSPSSNLQRNVSFTLFSHFYDGLRQNGRLRWNWVLICSICGYVVSLHTRRCNVTHIFPWTWFWLNRITTNRATSVLNK